MEKNHCDELTETTDVQTRDLPTRKTVVFGNMTKKPVSEEFNYVRWVNRHYLSLYK